MAFMSDVQSTYLAASGDVWTGRTRIKGIYVTVGAGSVTIKNGGSSGTTVMKIDTVAAGGPTYLLLPEDGILCENGAYAVLAGVGSATFFWA